jgi:peptidyl-Lys metalloendopeptidase
VDNFVVVATFNNTGDEALKLYQDPTTALSPFPVCIHFYMIFLFLIFIQEDKFTVSTSDGTVAEFIGADVKYTFEAATNFVELAPGATVSVSHQSASFVISVVPY